MDMLCDFGTYVNLWFNDYASGLDSAPTDKKYEPFFA